MAPARASSASRTARLLAASCSLTAPRSARRCARDSARLPMAARSLPKALRFDTFASAALRSSRLARTVSWSAFSYCLEAGVGAVAVTTEVATGVACAGWRGEFPLGHAGAVPAAVTPDVFPCPEAAGAGVASCKGMGGGGQASRTAKRLSTFQVGTCGRARSQLQLSESQHGAYHGGRGVMGSAPQQLG